MDSDNLSPMPTPTTEDPELHPGGADALEEDPADNGLGRDLQPEGNPAADDVPEAISEPDDKQQAPDEDTSHQEAGEPVGDPDAGQEAEDGSPEPPA
ncbi:hypothetical protein [Nocardioides sp. SYSU D00065]|uniref:hypothetical protein n=1 Tax=Nocardioides sp. SYSU D00065 TaxID=2817378 RepID=UPI001B336ED7|nr:hypothetical protein [Nocardioides sp. SYSU D00065]